MPRYLTYMEMVRPVLEAAGARYLARGGPFSVYEGDGEPARLVLLQFPSQRAFESFYCGPEYAAIKRIRDETSSANLVGVEGLPIAVRPDVAECAGRRSWALDDGAILMGSTAAQGPLWGAHAQD
jgi:uncharacterized protein (DUF1330 family)